MAGKGDKPRNCFTNNFKENFDQIKWFKKEASTTKEAKKIKQKTRYTYLTTDISNILLK